MNQIRILTAEDMQRCITMRQAIDAMGEAFIQLSEKQAMVPPRIHTHIEEHHATSLFMPAYLPSSKHISLKMVTVNHNNPGAGLPLIHALVVLMNVENGKPLALMDGKFITALRTGAASGLASRLLARKNSKTAAIFGAGAQGITQAKAILDVFPLEKIYVFDVSDPAVKNFISTLQTETSAEIVQARDEKVLAEVDIICAATTTKKPIFSPNHLKPGVHINGIGSYKPDMQEIHPEVIKSSFLVVDEINGCLKETGDLIIPIQQGLFDQAHIRAEIGEIASGKKEGRTSEKQITFFKSVGNAVQDIAVASRIFAYADEHDIGQRVNI